MVLLNTYCITSCFQQILPFFFLVHTLKLVLNYFSKGICIKLAKICSEEKYFEILRIIYFYFCYVKKGSDFLLHK